MNCNNHAKQGKAQFALFPSDDVMRFDSNPPLQRCPIGDYELSYLQAGAGAPVILVHGSLCDCRYWHPQMAALAREHTVIAVSLRHYWPEQFSPQRGRFAISTHADDLVHLLDALDLEQAHFVGHSRGGRVVLELALRHPRRVRSMVLADPGGRFATSSGPPPQHFVADAMADISAGNIEQGVARFVDAVNGEHTWQRMIEGFKRMARDNAGTLIGQAAEPDMAIDPAALHQLDVPTLLIGGAASPARYGVMLGALDEALPDARRVTIAGAAHGMNLAKPHTFNTVTLEFLQHHKMIPGTGSE